MEKRYNGGGEYNKNSNYNNNQPLVGIKVKLWDMDGNCVDFLNSCNETDDDLLSETTTNSSGFYYFYNIGNLEDIYITTNLETAYSNVMINSTTELVIASPVKTDFGTGQPTNIRYDWTVSCSNYWLYPNTSCNSTDALNTVLDSSQTVSNSEATASANVTATQLHVEGKFNSSIFSSDTTNFYILPNNPSSAACMSHCYDDANGDGNPDGNNTALPNGQDICVCTPYTNHRVAHEIGHSVMMRALGYPGSLSTCLNGHSWSQIDQYEKCAVSEGWANFFAAATFFSDTDTSAYYVLAVRNMEGLIDSYYNNGTLKVCMDRDTSPMDVEGNVSRFFWDLYDSTSVDDTFPVTTGEGDNLNLSMDQLVDIWREFPSGTDNLEASESGYDGRNIWDYFYHANAGFSINAGGPILSNCLCYQNGNYANCAYLNAY